MAKVETLATYLESAWGPPADSAGVTGIISALAAAAARVLATQAIRRAATSVATMIASALVSYAVNKVLSSAALISPLERVDW